MSNNKISNFITTLIVHFPVRHESEAREQEWLTVMARAFRDYDATVLSEAAQRVVETRKDRRFPLISELKDACATIIREKKQSTPSIFEGQKVLPQWSDDRIKLADELVMGPLGREAARDGWILSLHDYCRKNLSLPMGHDILACKRGAAGFDEAYAKLTRETSTPVTRSVIRLGDQMMARREQLRAMVLEGVIR